MGPANHARFFVFFSRNLSKYKFYITLTRAHVHLAIGNEKSEPQMVCIRACWWMEVFGHLFLSFFSARAMHLACFHGLRSRKRRKNWDNPLNISKERVRKVTIPPNFASNFIANPNMMYKKKKIQSSDHRLIECKYRNGQPSKTDRWMVWHKKIAWFCIMD